MSVTVLELATGKASLPAGGSQKTVGGHRFREAKVRISSIKMFKQN